MEDAIVNSLDPAKQQHGDISTAEQKGSGAGPDTSHLQREAEVKQNNPNNPNNLNNPNNPNKP